MAIRSVTLSAEPRRLALSPDEWRRRVEQTLVKAESAILANLVLGDLAIPEFLQSRCTVANLAPALAEIAAESPARRRQIEAFRRLDAILGTGGASASERAARAVLDFLARR